jgi:iron complex outermembrane recepter protein
MLRTVANTQLHGRPVMPGKSILAASLAGLVAVSGVSSALWGQNTQPPTLPETRVEATPVTTDYFAPEGSGLTGTILDGTILSNFPAYGYRAETSTTATIIAIPDQQLPATVSTITRDVMDDQIALRLTDIIRNAGGVVPSGNGRFPDELFIRGQQLGSRNFRKDGFLDPTFVPRDFQNVERVEILKGPASMLYGAGDPAGIVNLITKQPIANMPFANFGFTFGAYSQERYTLDMNGRASQSGNLLYRLNVAQEDVNSFVDFNSTNRIQVAPVVTWLISPCTTLTWTGEYHRDDRTGFQGTPSFQGNPLFFPPSRFVGEPANDFFNSEEFRQSLVLTTELGDDWVFRIGGNSLFYQFPNSVTSASKNFGFLPPPFGFGLPSATEPLYYRQRTESLHPREQSQSMIANLAGSMWTGEIEHKLLAGIEYNYFDSSSDFQASSPIDPMSPFFFQQFNAADPEYTNPDTFPLFGLNTRAFRQQRVGGYLQDFIDVSDNWKLLGSVRFDTVDFEFDRAVNLGGMTVFDDETNQIFNRVSPRAGVVYQPLGDDSLSGYYSYSQSFTPPSGGAYFDFGPLSPVLGESHEAGIKMLLLPDLALTACGFHITKQNDTFLLDPGALTQVGEVRSQGAELNLLGAITDDWFVTANYTYTDTLVTDTNPLINGRRARNVPYNLANLWTRYNFYNYEDGVIGAALGLIYYGDRPASLTAPNTFIFDEPPFDVRLPAYTRWDAGLYYRRGGFNTAVYLENLFDVQYAQSSVNYFQIFQGAPFNVRATVSYLY